MRTKLVACPRTSHRKRRAPQPPCCVLSRPRTNQYGGSLRPCLPVPAARRLPANVPRQTTGTRSRVHRSGYVLLMPPPELVDLRLLLEEIRDLDRARAVLEWDERTMMPVGGSLARAQQIATLERLRHERLRSPELGRLVDVLASYGEDIPYESEEASLIRIARHDHEKAARVPTKLKEEIALAAVEGEHAWREARAR